MKILKKKAWFKVMGCTVAAIFVVVASGCGTMMRGTKQNIALNSDPSGATAIVKSGKGEEIKVTVPTTVILKKSRKYAIDFQKEGYLQQTVSIERRMDKAMLTWDIVSSAVTVFLILVPVAVIVDWATGGWYKLTPENVSVVLEPANPAPAETPSKPPAQEPMTAPTESEKGNL